MITAKLSDIKQAQNIGLLCAAVSLAVGFSFWMSYQEKAGRMPLIPNSLWSKMSFTTICIMVMFSWAGVNSMEYFFSLL